MARQRADHSAGRFSQSGGVVADAVPEHRFHLFNRGDPTFRIASRHELLNQPLNLRPVGIEHRPQNPICGAGVGPLVCHEIARDDDAVLEIVDPRLDCTFEIA